MLSLGHLNLANLLDLNNDSGERLGSTDVDEGGLQHHLMKTGRE